MKYFYFFLLSITVLVQVSCNDDFGIEEIEVSYETVPFDRIRLETTSNIRIVQSHHFRVIVSGQRRDVDDTDVRVINGRLTIKERGRMDEEQLIKIFVPEIRQLENSGSSQVYGESQFRQTINMDLIQTGSGEMDLYVDTDNLDIELTGAGMIYLEGLADNVDATITGSGWIRSFSLNSDFSDVRIIGSGSAEVTVDADLDVIISGNGNVYYKGHPHIHATITGSGKLIDAN